MDDLKDIIQGNMDIVIEILDKVKNHILQSRNTVDMIVQKKIPIYGISTGFGKFKEIYIPHQEMVDLQKNLIISHASCVGEALKPNIVLVMMILRLNCLIRQCVQQNLYNKQQIRNLFQKYLVRFSWSIWRFGTFITFSIRINRNRRDLDRWIIYRCKLSIKDE
ncbi:unnamed protein product [Paramecium sonneborni]|uniref:Histidine ammonia-lyase n=1 Tax=Paramecium sonneborni TaxID=65129 RepID=A0A8S1JY68_9CILI|nr:unnamed protein product [Paramecium sonneborni]